MCISPQKKGITYSITDKTQDKLSADKNDLKEKDRWNLKFRLNSTHFLKNDLYVPRMTNYLLHLTVGINTDGLSFSFN